MKKLFLIITLTAFIAILTIPTTPAFAYKKSNTIEDQKEDDPYGGGVDVVYHLGKLIGDGWWKPNAIKGEYRYDKNNDAHTTYGVLVFEFGK